jgi:hypothetical protein
MNNDVVVLWYCCHVRLNGLQCAHASIRIQNPSEVLHMRKVFPAVLAVFATAITALPVLAFDNPPRQMAPGPNFEQRKAEIINRIDQRIARIQEEKACVQAAQNHDDIRACREKFKEEMKGQQQRRQ